jgi:hypothetical protein
VCNPNQYLVHARIAYNACALCPFNSIAPLPSFFTHQSPPSPVTLCLKLSARADVRYGPLARLHYTHAYTACSVGWWLMAGAGLFREKSSAGWLLVAGLM